MGLWNTSQIVFLEILEYSDFSIAHIVYYSLK